MRLAEHPVTVSVSQIHISAHSSNEVTRQNDRDKGKANLASTERVKKQNVVERGLLNHALGDTPSQASTSVSSADCVRRRTVEGDKVQNGNCR